ncbi:hypothetical protein [Alistipes indistinctus]|uniref:hypothetical protein n=1 Tax=Alistipes indistinctus TaxID=626932 RepID=UPI003F0FDBE2
MDPIEGILKLLRELTSVMEENGAPVDATRAELCREQMCLGTPHDIARLYRHGYGSVLRPGLVVVREADGQRTRKLRMVQLMATEEGCVMYQGGRCLLRETGLTPTQGRLHLLTGGRTDPEVQARTIVKIIAAWSAPENREAVEYCLRSLESNQNEISRNRMN